MFDPVPRTMRRNKQITVYPKQGHNTGLKWFADEQTEGEERGRSQTYIYSITSVVWKLQQI